MLDFSAMYWKEMKDLVSQGNTQMLVRVLIIAALSLMLPLQFFHNTWVQLPGLGIAFLLFTPLLIILSIVSDAFAGERERHTLESLLATRLSNWSIALGKMAVLITFAWVVTIIYLLVSLGVVNAMAGGAWHFYPLDRFLVVLFLSPITSIPVIALGMLISLRSTTVRQAQQTISYMSIGLGVITSLLIAQIAHLPFLSHLHVLSDTQMFLVGVGALLILDSALVALVLSLFRRARFLLD